MRDGGGPLDAPFADVSVADADSGADGSYPAVASTTLSAGFAHTCAGREDGTVICWGRSYSAAAPVVVPGLTDVVEVAAGTFHTCARLVGGEVMCWGANGSGQLGDGTQTSRDTPTPTGLSAVTLTSGGESSCAGLASGAMVCWGNNLFGQLGDDIAMHADCNSFVRWQDCSPTPVTVAGTAYGVARAGYAHACAVLASGRVVCWGDNSSGQLGDGVAMHADCDDSTGWQDCSATPVTVADLTDAVAIAVGYAHTCAVRRAGALVCWGRNGDGELGDGVATHEVCAGPTGASSDCSRTPVVVMGAGDWITVATGWFYTCAVQRNGTAACWGRNGDGQLGDGTRIAHPTPTAVTGLTEAVEITAGFSHTCARTASGVVCWGLNDEGQLGDGTTTTQLTPVAVAPPGG
jgi:alpha-tubulin suppressor-like RCC1 family protein